MPILGHNNALQISDLHRGYETVFTSLRSSIVEVPIMAVLP
jgi:hypothetical protein